MSYPVQVLKMGQSDVPGPEVYWMSHWQEWITLYFFMVVIRGDGHTVSSYAGPRCSMIETRRGTVIACDAAFQYGNLEKPHPLGIPESMEECHIAYERINRESSIALPLYDAEVLRRYPGGEVA